MNIRAKGQTGEREICDLLNSVAYQVMHDMSLQIPVKPFFQRNQNQSAVGGSDITNPFGLCIEVKRQEVLNVNAWWAQCVKASLDFGGRPILIFRQNGKRKWRVLMEGYLQIEDAFDMDCVVEVSHEDFLYFFRMWIRRKLQLAGPPATPPVASQLETVPVHKIAVNLAVTVPVPVASAIMYPRPWE